MKPIFNGKGRAGKMRRWKENHFISEKQLDSMLISVINDEIKEAKRGKTKHIQT